MIDSLRLDRIAPENAAVFKAIRLQALQESPLAFGSTYARESQLSNDDWIKRARDWSSHRSVGYLAMDGDRPCGIVASFLDEQHRERAHVISMWVNPDYRGRGLGRTLIDAVCAWAKLQKAHSLRLTVTSSNLTAIRFYQEYGFTMTGKTEPYPNDPSLFEHEMALPI